MVQLPATAATEYVAACWVSGPGGFLSGGAFVRGVFCPGDFFLGGLCPFPPSSMRIRTVQAFCAQHRSVTDKQKTKKNKKNRQTRPRISAGSRPPLPKFSGYVEVEAHYIFHPSTIWVQPLFTELGPKKTQKADFAMKQTNICRLSGDINNTMQWQCNTINRPTLSSSNAQSFN